MNIENIIAIATASLIPAAAYIVSIGNFTRINTESIKSLDAKIDKVETGLRVEMADMKAGVKAEMADMKAEMADIKAGMNARIDKVEVQMKVDHDLLIRLDEKLSRYAYLGPFTRAEPAEAVSPAGA